MDEIATRVVGLRNTGQKEWQWLGEGQAFVIGRTLDGFVLPDDLVNLGFSHSLFKNSDDKMRKQHALVYVASGRVLVRILKTEPKSRGLSVLTSPQTGRWSDIGEGGMDEEIKQGAVALTASRSLRFVVKLDWGSKTRPNAGAFTERPARALHPSTDAESEATKSVWMREMEDALAEREDAPAKRVLEQFAGASHPLRQLDEELRKRARSQADATAFQGHEDESAGLASP